ncbi:MAG: DUF1156 domain-containing protein [Thermoplasmatota archaeon]
MSEENGEKERPRLKIEDSLPIRAVGIENERENKHYSDLPPQKYVHVWWARRPTPVTRLAILSSVLPNTVDDDTLLKWMQMNPSNKKEEDSIASHIRKKKREKEEKDELDGLVYEHYGYRKAYKNLPDESEMDRLHSRIKNMYDGELPTIFDATAGGGSIPFESLRYGFPTIANELNPVASIILKAVLEHPRTDNDLSEDIERWGKEIHEIASEQLSEYFPSQQGKDIVNYFWAHTIKCPDCGLKIPLSPNWWLDKKSGSEGVSAKLELKEDSDEVSFEIVELPKDVKKSEYDPTNGTISRGKATCPRCKVVIDDEVKRQAQEEGMGYQLYAVEIRDLHNNNRGNFRPPREEDINSFNKAKKKVEQSPEFSSLLREKRYVGPADRSTNYGITEWRDMFSPRQLLVHHTYWQAFKEVRNQIQNEHPPYEAEVIMTFLAIVADKALNYNCRQSSWINDRGVIRSVFERHDFAFKWSFTEINLTVDELGYEWFLENTIGAYKDLRDLSCHSDAFVDILQEDAASLSLDSESVEAIVLDPPYYDNVMYAELSDFFYVWLKKYLSDVYPEFFEKELTEKDEEAVANSAKFKDVAGENQSKKELAKKDYEKKMTEIFDEMHRVLDDEGIFTLMFTHKKTDAWDTLTKALIEAGFIVKATHPISTENPEALNQKGKNAAESTILIAAEKRKIENDEYTLWSDVKKKTREAALTKVKELDNREIEFTKVDMILASFGPTLQVFTENYPVIDDEGNEIRPQTALDKARNAVRDYLIKNYLNEGVRDVDPISEWYILSWLVFEAERFPYDEANRLGKGVGVEIDDIKRSNRLWRKKSNDIILRSHDERVQTPADKEKSRTTKTIDPDALTFENDLDKVHAVMYVFNNLGASETVNYIKERGLESDKSFKATCEALLRVIPHKHKDWEILRDMVLTDIGDLLDLDLDKDIFKSEEEDSTQARMTEYN